MITSELEYILSGVLSCLISESTCSDVLSSFLLGGLCFLIRPCRNILGRDLLWVINAAEAVLPLVAYLVSLFVVSFADQEFLDFSVVVFISLSGLCCVFLISEILPYPELIKVVVFSLNEAHFAFLA